MSDPDWDRVLVHQGKTQPVGDPTRWGAQEFTLLPVPSAATQNLLQTQIIQAATRDGYSRSWALNGTLSLPADLWTPGALGVEVSLQIQMGVGQAQVLHEIMLWSPVPQGGLCDSQYFPNGGPYVAYTSPPLSQVPGVVDRTRAFAAIGALVGATINIRAKYNLAAAAAAAVFPTRSLIQLVLTPFAAGTGL